MRRRNTLAPTALAALAALLWLASPHSVRAEAAAEGTDPGFPRSGKVFAVRTSGVYTYAEVEDGEGKKFCVAAPRFAVNDGDRIEVLRGKNYGAIHSEQLNCDFPDFVGAVTFRVNERTYHAVGHGQSMMMTQELMTQEAEGSRDETPAAGSIAPASPGGQTVASLFDRRDELTGKPVSLRARVMSRFPDEESQKVYRLMDGTGVPGANVVLLRTAESLEPGRVVLVQGILAVATDAGQKTYPLSVEAHSVE